MTDAKQQVLEAFADVGFAEQRFINVNEGQKGTFDHDTRYDDPHDVPGTNYGIYSDADQLVVLDVDVHKEGSDEIADEPVGRLNHLGMTFTIQSPHTDADGPGGHRFFRLEGDETAAELFKRAFGKKNPVPSWGEVISENKYVVGAGSELDGCDKDWCDECATADGGRYVVKHDTPVRSVKPDTLVDVLDADPDLERRDTDSDVTNYSSSGEKDNSAKNLSESEGDGSDLTEAEVEELLEAIPGDQHFDDWIRTGYAVYGCLGKDGKEIFQDWSEDNEDWEKEESQRQIDYIFQEAKPNDDGETYAGPGTLIHEAREHEYDGDIGAAPDKSKPEAADEPDDPDELTWYDVRARYEFVQQEDNYTKGYARQAAADVLENETSWMYVRESERLWVYDGQSGQYDKYGAAKAQSVLEDKLGEHYTASEKREIIDRLEARNQVHRKVLNAREHDDPLVCVGNCVVNLRTGESTDHSPEYRFVRGLDVEWHPAEADPDKIVNFLDDVTQRPEDRDTLLDHLAHGLMPGHPYRAFVVCYGPGGNGKTQVSELFRGFVGRQDNAAAVEIDELAEGDFATGDLPGTFINWGDDMAGDGGGQLSDLSLLKKATGGSEIRANEKYEKTFNFKNEAAMFFSANEPPRIGEQKASIQDRIYPIEMPYRFTSDPDPDEPMEKEKTPNISKDLLEDDAAMRGLLLLAVQHAQELIESRGEYSQPESPAERLEKYNRSADPIVKFGSRALEAASGEYMIRKDDAYRVFRDMAESWEERSASEDGFKRQLPGAINFDVEGARSRALASADDGQDRVRCWKRVKWTPFAREFMPDWLLSRYADHFEDSDDDAHAAADGDDEPTPVPERDAGYETFTATVTAVIDPKPWLEGEGTLVDETGAVIDYTVRDGSDSPPTLEEGEEYHFQRARLTADEGGAAIVEIRPGATEVKTTTEPSSVKDHHQSDDTVAEADPTETTDRADASATDGGTTDESADMEGVDIEALDEAIMDELDFRGSCSIGKLAAALAEKHDHPPDKTKHRVEKLTERGDIIDNSGGARKKLTTAD